MKTEENGISFDERLKIIGDTLYNIRHSKREKIVGVAKSVGISHPVISQIENGRYTGLTLSLLCKLADHYDVPVEYIVGKGQNKPVGRTGALR